MVEVSLKITGKVQGVFFRGEAQAKAHQLNVCGWIKNNDDGTVTCVAQGDKENIEKFIEWCQQGPSLADVRHVKIEWNKNPLNTYSDFSIYRI